MRITQDFVDNRIDTLLVDMSKGTRPSDRAFAFRCSSLPFCPIRAFLGMDKGQESFGMDFYTGIGTAVHEVAQRWINRGNLADRVFARWKCSECSNITDPGFKPDSCPSCGCVHPAFGYEEVEITYRGLSGHVDLIYEIAPDKFVVMDFKTTNLSEAKKRANWQNNYPASPSSIVQIGAYCMMLRRVYGLDVVAWSLIYVDRGKAIASHKDYHKVTRPWGARKHLHMRRLVDRACANNETLNTLRSSIAAADGYSEAADQALRAVVRARPCRSDDSYRAWMAYKFHRFSKDERTCKFKDVCCGPSNRAVYDKILRTLETR